MRRKKEESAEAYSPLDPPQQRRLRPNRHAPGFEWVKGGREAKRPGNAAVARLPHPLILSHPFPSGRESRYRPRTRPSLSMSLVWGFRQMVICEWVPRRCLPVQHWRTNRQRHPCPAVGTGSAGACPHCRQRGQARRCARASPRLPLGPSHQPGVWTPLRRRARLSLSGLRRTMLFLPCTGDGWSGHHAFHQDARGGKRLRLRQRVRPAHARAARPIRARIADRHFGVGGDGLILICPSTQADARMRMFNADGSESDVRQRRFVAWPSTCTTTAFAARRP